MATTFLPPFEFSVKCGRLAAREALEMLMAALDPLDLSLDDKGMIELVVAEILNNIVKHAYWYQVFL